MSALVGATATPLENVPGLGEGLIEKLTAAGVTTVEALADMTPEQLEAIEGIGPKTIEKISIAVNNYFSALESGEGAVPAEAELQGEGLPEAPPEEDAGAKEQPETVAAVEAEAGRTGTPEATVEESEIAEGTEAEAPTSSDKPS